MKTSSLFPAFGSSHVPTVCLLFHCRRNGYSDTIADEVLSTFFNNVATPTRPLYFHTDDSRLRSMFAHLKTVLGGEQPTVMPFRVSLLRARAQGDGGGVSVIVIEQPLEIEKSGLSVCIKLDAGRCGTLGCAESDASQGREGAQMCVCGGGGVDSAPQQVRAAASRCGSATVHASNIAC